MKKNLSLLALPLLCLVLVGCNAITTRTTDDANSQADEEIQVSEESVESVCNGIVATNSSCAAQAEAAAKDPVTITEDRQTLIISLASGCGTNVKVKSVSEENGKVAIGLVEEGPGLLCGGDLVRVTLKLNKPVTLANLEISDYLERSGETTQIYPVN